jgi:tripartite-type tricarboxylate transporter receptor subunit TctC
MKSVTVRFRRRGLLLWCAASALPRAAVRAQQWPSRPIRLVIPFGAGGSVDFVGRLLAERLEPVFGQPVVVDNRPGGATAIGAVHVARSAPDGHTLFYGTPATLMVNPFLVRSLPYDPDRDFASVVSVMRAPNLLAVHPSLGVRDIAGLRGDALQPHLGTGGDATRGDPGAERRLQPRPVRSRGGAPHGGVRPRGDLRHDAGGD